MKKKDSIIKGIVNSVLPVILAFAFGAIIIAAIGESPLETYGVLIRKSLLTEKGFTTGMGGYRVRLSLREVTAKDMDLLYEWANDPTVRQNAFHTEPIPYENHKMWFAKNLADREVLMYILCSINM